MLYVVGVLLVFVCLFTLTFCMYSILFFLPCCYMLPIFFVSYAQASIAEFEYKLEHSLSIYEENSTRSQERKCQLDQYQIQVHL